MSNPLRGCVAAGLLAVLTGAGAQTAELGASVEGLLVLARERNPEIAAMRHEAQAFDERIAPAGALPDPKFRIELEDVTKGGEQNATLLPSRVGATSYLLMQDFPWSGKRELKRDIALFDAEGALGRVRQSWADLAARIKTTFVQRYLIQGTQRLVGENIDLMLQLEKVLQVRYAGGLAAQQDITRIHVEHTGMRAELVALANEWRQTQARLNALLARPAQTELAAPALLRTVPEPAKLDFNALSERLRSANPQIFVTTAVVRSAEKARDLTFKNRYPDFTVGLTAMQSQNSLREWGLMLEFNIPLQQNARKSQEREAEAMLAAARARQEAAANQALADLSDNLYALAGARETERLMTFSLMPQADLTWRAALAGYENGKLDFATLLDAQRQIRQARLSQLKAQVDAQMRLIEIERLLGEEV